MHGNFRKLYEFDFAGVSLSYHGIRLYIQLVACLFVYAVRFYCGGFFGRFAQS